MKVIELYEAPDGKRFDTAYECVRYEAILAEVEDILLHITTNDSIDFSNGEGYIQHEESGVMHLNQDFLRLVNKWFQPEVLFTEFTYEVGRMIDDSNMKCLKQLDYKIECIDDKNREWGQPYYAMNPGSGNQTQLN